MDLFQLRCGECHRDMKIDDGVVITWRNKLVYGGIDAFNAETGEVTITDDETKISYRVHVERIAHAQH